MTSQIFRRVRLLRTVIGCTVRSTVKHALLSKTSMALLWDIIWLILNRRSLILCLASRLFSFRLLKKKGILGALIEECLTRPCCQKVQFYEGTIYVDNEPVQRSHHRLASDWGCDIELLKMHELFPPEQFAPRLYLKIGPFQQEKVCSSLEMRWKLAKL